jgi:phage tail-like protein
VAGREILHGRLNGHEPSRLLAYLPGIFSDDPFLSGYLNIFDAIWKPLERQIDQVHAYVDPRLAPPEFLTWLGTWLDLVLDENWPEARRRTLIRRAADLYLRRGTAGALRDYLAIFLGTPPEISEDGGDANPFHFTVIVRLDAGSIVDEDRLRRIIEEEKPAHTTYTLRLETRDA